MKTLGLCRGGSHPILSTCLRGPISLPCCLELPVLAEKGNWWHLWAPILSSFVLSPSPWAPRHRGRCPLLLQLPTWSLLPLRLPGPEKGSGTQRRGLMSGTLFPHCAWWPLIQVPLPLKWFWTSGSLFFQGTWKTKLTVSRRAPFPQPGPWVPGPRVRPARGFQVCLLQPSHLGGMGGLRQGCMLAELPHVGLPRAGL